MVIPAWTGVRRGSILRGLITLAAAGATLLYGAQPAAAAVGPQITSTPTNATTDTPLTWAFDDGGNPASCELTSGAATVSALADCGSPVTYDVTGNPAGSYTLTVYGATADSVTSGTPSDSSTVTVAPASSAFTASPSSPGNSTAPTWSFTLDTGATASCEVDDDTGTAVQGPTPCASPFTADLSGQTGGSFTLSVTPTAGGVTGATTTSAPYQLDTTAPPAPTVSGPSSPSADRGPQFTIADTEPGVSFTCWVTGPATTPAAPCTSPVTMDLTGDPDGTYTMHVQAADAAGNPSLAATADYTLAAQAPPAPVVTPVTASPGNSRSPQFSVSDGETGVGFSCAATDSAGNPVTATSCGPTTVLDLTNAPQGAVQLVVTATDATGNFTSTTISWTLDTTPPAPPAVTMPTSPGRTRSPSFGVTDTEPGVSYTCSASDSAGNPVAVTSCSTTTTLDLTGAPDGPVTLAVAAVDAAGNTGSGTTVVWTLDTTPPSAPMITVPSSPSPVKAPTFGISDSDPGVVLLTCHFTSPSGRDVFATGPCPAPATFDTTGYRDGSYTLTVTATDAAGNTAATVVTWVRDTTGPAAVLITAPPSPGSTRSPSFTVSEADPTATLSCQAAGPGGAVTVSSCGALTTLDLTGQPDGVVTLTVTATDTAGNQSSATASWILDTEAPAAARLTGPAIGSTRTVGVTVSGAEVGTTLHCTVTGPGAAQATGCSGGTTSVKIAAGAPDGAYTLTVTVADAAGNVSPPASYTYVLDTIPPPVPTAALHPTSGSLTASGLQISNSLTPTLVVSDADGSAVLSCRIVPVSGGAQPLSQQNASCPTQLDLSGYDAPGGVDRELDVVVTASDAAGNTASTTLRYVLDTLPPEAALITSEPTGSTPFQRNTFQWSVAAGVTYTCTITAAGSDTPVAGPVACTPQTGWTVQLPKGSYVFTVTATDQAGNATSTAGPAFTIDPLALIPPTIASPGSPGNDPDPRWRITEPAGATDLSCSLSEDDKQVFGPAECPHDGRFNLASRPDGDFQLTVVATFPTGTSQALASYRLDRQPPARPELVDRPHPTGRGVGWAFLLPAGTTGDCSLLHHGRVVQSGDCADTASYALPHDAAGRWQFQVTAEDAAGNLSRPLVATYRMSAPPPPPPPSGGNRPPPTGGGGLAMPEISAPSGPGGHPVWHISDSATSSFLCTVRRGRSVVIDRQHCTSTFAPDLSAFGAGVYTLTVTAIRGGRAGYSVSVSYDWSSPRTVGSSAVRRTSRFIQHLIRDPRTVHGHHQGSRGTPARTAPPDSNPLLPPSVRRFAEGVQSVVSTIGRAGGGAGFPLLLLLLVGLFLLVQNRIDRRDPKLALASVGADDWVEFTAPPSQEPVR